MGGARGLEVGTHIRETFHLLREGIARRCERVARRAQLGVAGVGAVLLQPQPVCQQVAQRILHLGFRGEGRPRGQLLGSRPGRRQRRDFAQAGAAVEQLAFERVGEIEDFREEVATAGQAALTAPEENQAAQPDRGHADDDDFHGRLCSWIPGESLANPQADPVQVDRDGGCTYHRAPMSAALPDRVDVARQVQARRTYEGTLPLAAMKRLCGSLAVPEGDARYRVEFGRDELGVAYLELDVETGLPLLCQRTLEVFVQPVSLHERLGLIADEQGEAALPPGYEPLLVADGSVGIADVIEDELILALPVVPVKPGEPLEWKDTSDEAPDEKPASPFAVLAGLKK